MKNFEAYEDKIKGMKGKIALNKSNELVSCIGFRCSDCKFSGRGNGKYCLQNMFEWLYKEHQKPKIKIPLATKVILENLNEKYKWIAKDVNGKVWAYENRPKKEIDINKWANVDSGYMCGFAKVFKEGVFDFLSWGDEEPTNIKELLENCEGIEDE